MAVHAAQPAGQPRARTTVSTLGRTPFLCKVTKMQPAVAWQYGVTRFCKGWLPPADSEAELEAGEERSADG